MIQRSFARPALGLNALLILTYLAAATGGCAGEEPAHENEKRLARQLRPELLAPENAVFYLSTPDIRKVKAAYERSAFKSLLGEDEILTPVMSAFSKLRDTYVKGDGTRSDAEIKRRNEEVDLLVKVLPMLESQAAIVIDSDASGLSAISSGKLPRFLLIASMPPGDAGSLRQQDLEDIFDKYRGRLAIDSHYHDFDSDRGIYKLHGLDNGDLGTFEAWAFVENLFIYGQGKGIVEDAIERYATKKGAGSMALNSAYQSAYKQVGRDEKGEALVYVQFDPQALSGGDRMNSPIMQYLTSMPNGGSEAVHPQLAFGMNAGEGVNAPIREKLFVRTALSKDAASKPAEGCKGRSARFVAGDGLFYWATTGNLFDIYTQNKEMLGSFFGGSQLMEQKFSGAMNAKDPAELKKKMDLFKGEMSAFMDYVPRAAKFTGWSDILANFQLTLCLEIDNENLSYEAALSDMMKKLEQGTGIQYVTTNASGSIIHYQRGAAGELDRAATFLGLRANLGTPDSKHTPFFASWVRVEAPAEPDSPPRHYLLLSDDLPSLRKAMAQRGSPRTSLYEDARYKEVMKSFRESRTEITYFDLAKLSTVYNSLMPLVTKAELIDRDTVAQFPSVNALKPHLFPMSAARSAASNGEGILTEFSSPTGNLSLAALIASVAWPAINAQRQRGISDEVDAKFKQINLALQLYAADFDRYPPQLSDLLTPNYIDPRRLNVFESPFNRGALQSASDIDNPDLTNFVYCAGHNLTDLGKEILLYEKLPTSLERGESKLMYHVLQIDGKVRGIPKVTLDRVLQNKFSSTTIGEKGKGGAAGGSAPPPKKK